MDERTPVDNTVREVSGNVVQAGRIDQVVLRDRTPTVDWSIARGTSNLPARNPDFTGQRDVLASLEANLERFPMVAMRGLGGVGKSQLALEYAHRSRARYVVRWWVRAGDEQTLTSDLMSLAAALGLDTAPEQELVLALLSAELGKRDDWLLVLDNAQDPDVLYRVLRAERGHVLVTTRTRHWTGVARPVEVAEMSEQDAAAFLADGTSAAAVELTRLLGRLPLALAQARSYAEVHGCSLSRYLELYRRAAEEMLRIGPKPVGYPHTVATTWLLHFQMLSPTATALLEFTAFLAPDSIPIDLLLDAGEYLPQPLRDVATEPLAREKAIGELIATSLLARTYDDTVRVHRLVQQVTRSRLAAKERALWQSAAVGLLNNLMPQAPGDPASWQEMERLGPHIRAVATQVKPTQRMAAEAGQLLTGIGIYLLYRGERAAAIEMFNRALPMYERLGRAEPLMQADIWSYIGFAQSVSDPRGAVRSFNQAITLVTNLLGNAHPQLVKPLVALATHLGRLGMHEEALPRLQAALAIRSAQGGPPDVDLLAILQGLAVAMHGKGEFEAALELYRQTVEVSTTLFGPGHHRASEITVNYASAALSAGKPDLARTLLADALTVLRKQLGADHDTTLAAEKLAAQMNAD